MVGKLRAALLGSPVRHSLSPQLHAAAGRVAGIEVEYGLDEVNPAELSAVLSRARDSGLNGLNLTAPLKSVACELVDELTPVARTVSAVNTIVFQEDGRLLGANTDVFGFTRSLMPQPTGPVIILGSGGAARAAVHACLDLGMSEICVCGRTPGAVDGLLKIFDDARLRGSSLLRAGAQMGGCSLLVNCLPPEALSVVEELPFVEMDAAGLVYDMNYAGREAAFRRAALGAQRRFQDGLAMLFWQGLEAFRLWTGVEVSLAQLRQAMETDGLFTDSN